MDKNELVQLFVDKFHIDELEEKEQLLFLKNITAYLQHNRNSELKGRTIEFLEGKINKFVHMCEILGLSSRQMIDIVGVFPSLLNTIDDFYYKYLILGVIENEDNTLRKSKLVNKPRDFAVGLKQVYARYKLVCETGYTECSWNSLVHASKKEFARIFVRGTYKKPYQFFNSVESVITWLDSVDPSELDISSFKELDVNKEIVSKYEERNKGFK